jgi:NTP pyrophosphatase (non-canonical NTP hydrolase)
MWDHLARLHSGFLADIDEQMLIMKIAEEFGEAVQAYIGVTGQNPRKGIYATRDDVQKELADVIVTAGIAMIGMSGGDADEARAHLEKRLALVTERAGV